LLDSGSSYNIGDTLSVAGGTVNSIITVTGINDNSNTVMEIGGISVRDLNDVFEIVQIPNSKEIILNAPLGISTYEPNTNGERPFIIPSGESVGISSALLTNISSGIATFITTSAHGLFAGNKIKIVQTGATGLEGDFVVRDVTGITTFTVVSYGATVVGVADTGFVLRKTFDSNARNIGSGEENLGSRASYFYDKVSVHLDTAFDYFQYNHKFLRSIPSKER